MGKLDWNEVERYYATQYCEYLGTQRCGTCASCRDLAALMKAEAKKGSGFGCERWVRRTFRHMSMSRLFVASI